MAYLPIRLNTLRPGHQVIFDVFLRFGEKHVHYIRKSEPFEKDRITKLKEKGVKKLFIRDEDEPLYLDYLDAGLTTLSNANIALSEKGTIAYDTLVTDAENAEHHFDTEQGYQKVEGRVGKVIQFLSSDRGALLNMLTSAGCAADDFQHSANVSSLSVGLAQRVGGISDREMFDLAMAALVHDVGKNKLGFAGIHENDQMTPEQKKAFRKHASAGLEYLSVKKQITPTILRLVAEHEELGEGEGYPERKKIESMSPTSQILSLCNHLDCMSMVTKIPTQELIKTFFQEKALLFSLDHMAKLSDLLLGK